MMDVNKLTNSEKLELVDNYCKEIGCESCKLGYLCRKINGNFGLHKEELDEAVELIVGLDNVHHPHHYNQGNIECIDAMISAFGKQAVANFCMCNAFKYMWRHKQKGGIEDIDKMDWYLNKYKELLEGDDNDE